MARINDKKDSVAIEEGKKYDLFIDSLVCLIRKYGTSFLDKKDE